jgi:hypothetical protein
MATAFAKHPWNGQRADEIKTYLNNIPLFPVGSATLDNSLGLMILQYCGGVKAVGEATVLILYNELSEYKAAHSESFTYWGLGNTYLQLCFYSDNENKASSILQEDILCHYVY